MTTVRRAAPPDLDTLAWLERAVFAADAWSPRSLEQELDGAGAGRDLFVAVDGSQVVGYSAVAYNDDTADLLRVAVHPDHRRRGVARRLCAETLAAVEPMCTRMLLEVATDNVAALALYSRLGFIEIDRRRRYYAGGADAVVMELAFAGAGPKPPSRETSARSADDSRPLERRYAPGRQEGDAS